MMNYDRLNIAIVLATVVSYILSLEAEIGEFFPSAWLKAFLAIN
jgi:hypothetical protein